MGASGKQTMIVKVVKASKEHRKVVQNLAAFYTYDMSRTCGWEVPENGSFSCFDLGVYWEDEKRHPFVLTVDGHLAGFALIHPYGLSPDVEWVMGEFFVTAKYQGKGIGAQAAVELFNRFPGKWEAMAIPDNRPAIKFWEKVIGQYSGGKYEMSEVEVHEPKPHPMLAFTFLTRNV